MTEIPQYRVLVEDFPDFPSPNLARIHPNNLDLAAVARGEVDCEDCVNVRIGLDTYLEDPAVFDDFNGRLGLVAETVDARQLLDVRRLTRDREHVELRLPAAHLGDGAAAMLAGSLDIPVVLEPGNDYTPAQLENVMEFFLFAPNLRAPIQPFAAIGGAMANAGRNTLWKTYDEALGMDFFVDVKGRVSLSPRWAAVGRFFGTVQDSMETLKSSSLWQHVEGLPRRVFTELSPCCTCPHFTVCGGFLLAGVQEDESCETWKAGLDHLLEAFQTVMAQEGAAAAAQQEAEAAEAEAATEAL